MSPRQGTHLSRRSVVQGSIAAGTGLVLGTRSGLAQDSSPAASPMASPTAFASKIAERASGDVRLNVPADVSQQKIISEQVEDLMSIYPNIKVDFQPVSAEYLTKIQSDIAAGNAADVFAVQNEYAQDFMSRNTLLDIDDFMSEDGVTKDEFYTPLIDAYTWKASSTACQRTGRRSLPSTSPASSTRSAARSPPIGTAFARHSRP